MALTGEFEVVRDPIWNNIRVDRRALAVVDSAPFQRLRYVRQLGHAYLVYPGATHTRFEHALGAYHLARRALNLLGERGELDAAPADAPQLVQLAALLHDIGHYPFSHALEEAGLPSHEELAIHHFAHPELADGLAALGIADAAARISALVRGESANPLQGLIAGSLDLDKIEYLTRDARMCGVPYGAVDVDRLLHSLTLVRTPDGTVQVGVHEKGLSALESLLFAKYQMYRNVYWHHAVRSATCMFKRLVRTALAAGAFDTRWVADATDEALMESLRAGPGAALAERLHRRQLYKRILDLRAAELPDAGAWVSREPALVQRVEDRLAGEAGLPPGGILLDFPSKPDMLAVDLPIVMRDGSVERLDSQDAAGRLGLQRIAGALHTEARRLRVFAATPVPIERDAVVALVTGTREKVRALLESDSATSQRED